MTQSLLDTVVIGGDLLLLPEQQPLPIEEARALREGKTVSVQDSVLIEATEQIYSLSNEYRAYRGIHGQEPPWLSTKPISVQRRLRLDWAALEEEPLSIANLYPHTGLSYMVRMGGLCEDLCRTFNLWRLADILQLGYLQAPWFKEELYPQPIGQHNRFVHSLDVMAIASVIGHNLGLTESEFNTLRMMALTHDMGTPAGGDSVKLVDLEAFDEDLNYPRFLAKVDWQWLKDKYQINEKLLVEGIMNRGLLGQVLDIADKLAYTARDMHACLPYLEFGAAHFEEQYGLKSLLQTTARYPNVCGLWDAVDRVGEQMVITDPARLSAFLKVRTLMFRELYLHPHARFGEYLVSRILVKDLYDRGVLTRDQLLDMVDYQLNDVLDREYGEGRHRSGNPNLIEETARAGAQCRTFYDEVEAEAFAASLRNSGNPFVLLENNSKLIKTGTHFKVLTDDGPQPFAFAHPGEAQELEEMAKLYPAIHVYWLEREPAMSRATLAALAKRLQSKTAAP